MNFGLARIVDFFDTAGTGALDRLMTQFASEMGPIMLATLTLWHMITGIKFMTS